MVNSGHGQMSANYAPDQRNAALSDSPAKPPFHGQLNQAESGASGQLEPPETPLVATAHSATRPRGRPPKLPSQSQAQPCTSPEFNFRKSPKKRFRGTPPPSTIDIATLPDTAFLSEHETAAFLRRPKVSLEYWRRHVPNHPLKWRRIAGRILYEVSSLRELLKGGERGDT